MSMAGRLETSRILTKADCTKICVDAGLTSNMAVMVHASLKGLGYLVNGPYDLIDAMMVAVHPRGTILVPTHTGQLTDPADWTRPVVPTEWVDTIRQNMAPFDARKTPVRGRGILPEYFLRYGGVKRSVHPLNSVAALGADAGYFIYTHALQASEGIDSPCYKLFKKNGHVILFGVGLEVCSALHVAEYIVDVPYLSESTVEVAVDDRRGGVRFIRLVKYPGTSKYFEKLRPELRESGHLKELVFDDGYTVTLLELAPAVNLAVDKLRDDPLYFRRD